MQRTQPQSPKFVIMRRRLDDQKVNSTRAYSHLRSVVVSKENNRRVDVWDMPSLNSPEDSKVLVAG
jgi:hypothetical protein